VPLVVESSGTAETNVLPDREMSLDHALAHLFGEDYFWREMDGVVVIRPAREWANARSSLHHSMEVVDWTEVSVATVFEHVGHRLLGMRPIERARPREPILLTLNMKSTSSVLEVLTASARAHGRMLWSVSGKSVGFMAFNEDGTIGDALSTRRGPQSDGRP
jgi:hypothetical protein